jgi:hypothetical protein
VGDQIKSVRIRINQRKATLQLLEQEEDTTTEKERIRSKIKETLTARYRCILKTRELIEQIIGITIAQDKLVLQRSQVDPSCCPDLPRVSAPKPKRLSSCASAH